MRACEVLEYRHLQLFGGSSTNLLTAVEEATRKPDEQHLCLARPKEEIKPMTKYWLFGQTSSRLPFSTSQLLRLCQHLSNSIGCLSQTRDFYNTHVRTRGDGYHAVDIFQESPSTNLHSTTIHLQ